MTLWTSRPERAEESVDPQPIRHSGRVRAAAHDQLIGGLTAIESQTISLGIIDTEFTR
jgi:hypothetical protein